MNKLFLSFFAAGTLFLASTTAKAQLMLAKDLFTKADSLRGQLTPLRTCYDVQYYHLDIQVDIDKKYISGSNLIRFKTVEDFKTLQIDLFDNLSIDRIVYRGKNLKFDRQHHAVFVHFPKKIKRGKTDSFTVYYSGNPIQATRAPWIGGFDWKKDSNGKPFVATAVQGLGASAWWPNKDHQSDEPDSMRISVAVPNGLINVSNGRLEKVEPLNNGYTKYHWKVVNPINNYNVAVNIGDYITFNEKIKGEKGELDVVYYILKENDSEDKKEHLRKNVRQTIEAFEYWFGPYPFYEDSYKIVETAHLGMEHQSAIAYGNKFLNGYLGRDGSGTGWGKKWDFIVVHESGHEWFGNNITAKDIADMWIHESFTNYSEALFIEYFYGKEAAQEYIYGNRRGILNDKPIQGPYHVNKEGSGDMYNKGGVILNMIRTIVNDDIKWRNLLRDINKDFRLKQVDYNDILNYMNQYTGKSFDKIFEQYLKTNSIPTLLVKQGTDGKVYGRWKAQVENFRMPVLLGLKGQMDLIELTDTFQKIDIENLNIDNLIIDTFNFYINVEIE